MELDRIGSAEHRRRRFINHPARATSFVFTRPLKLSALTRWAWWVADRGQTLDRKNVRVRLPSSLTRRLGNAMRASQKSKRKKAKANRVLCYVSSTLSMATHSLVNMGLRGLSLPSRGAVLLALLRLPRVFEICRTQKCRHRRSCRRRLVPAALPDLQTAWARRICGWQRPMRGI